MKYKKDDGKKDNWLDDILWGVPLGDSFAINLKSGEVIPRYRIGDGFIPGENGDDDWEKDEFAFGKLDGVLIAERISATVREAAQRAGIAAYEIEWPVTLRRVA